jgi:anti-sigma28 factor (negative regulator of flagellin synthesis)
MDIRRIDGPAGVWKTGEASPRKPAAPARAGAKDRVELGAGSEGRNPAAGLERLAKANTDVRQEKVEAVREKVETGFYDRPEVISQVADKMVDGGFTG